MLCAAGLLTTNGAVTSDPAAAWLPGSRVPPTTRDIERAAAVDQGIRGDGRRPDLLSVDPDPVGTPEIEEGDGGIGHVQPRMFAGQLGIRNDDLGSAAADPEPSAPERKDQAGAGPAVHDQCERRHGAGGGRRHAVHQDGALDEGAFADVRTATGTRPTDSVPVP